ncbi:MAG: hypothetical protein LUJ09_05715 [Firmicutes bacterium]|nr:hypothetical protein [Bacillota bacterium]
MEEEKPEEARANPYHDPKNGRFTTGGGKAKKTKYAPSLQANKSKIRVSPQTFGMLRGQFNTKYPNATPEDGYLPIYLGKYMYKARADGYGSIAIDYKIKIGK